MSDFRKNILRSSLTTDDYEQETDFKRLDIADKLLDELFYVYYGYNSSFLPYTHDEIKTDDGITYRFNPEATEIFIDELLSTIDEQYWRNYPLPDELFDNFNEDTKQFYRSFLYLAIRIASTKITSKIPDKHHEPIGEGTFKDLLTLSRSLVIPYSEAGFHRRFEIGIPTKELPPFFFDIDRICRALGKEKSFLHSSKSIEEQEKAIKEDTEIEQEHIRMVADENGIDLDQLQASEQYLKETTAFYRKQENKRLKEQLADFEDADAFIRHATIYRDLIFHYNNHDSEQYIEIALKLFLLRNDLSALSTESGCKTSHNDIATVIEKLRQ